MSEKNWHEKLLEAKKIAQEILKIDDVDKVYTDHVYQEILVTQEDNKNDSYDKFIQAHEKMKNKIEKITADLPQPWSITYGNWYRRHNLNKKEYLQKIKEIAEKIEDLKEVKLIEINEDVKYIFIKLYDSDDNDGNEEKNYEAFHERYRKFENKIKEITGDYPRVYYSSCTNYYVYFEDIHV